MEAEELDQDQERPSDLFAVASWIIASIGSWLLLFWLYRFVAD